MNPTFAKANSLRRIHVGSIIGWDVYSGVDNDILQVLENKTKGEKVTLVVDAPT